MIWFEKLKIKFLKKIRQIRKKSKHYIVHNFLFLKKKEKILIYEKKKKIHSKNVQFKIDF